MGPKRIFLSLALASAATTGIAAAQARDASNRLKEVLPPDVAERVLARIAEARARELPATALEQRALKFAAKGVDPAAIEQSVSEHIDRLVSARQALEAPRGRRADGGELEAGAEAVRRGIGPSGLSELASAAPSGRSLAVPLYVLANLLDRGLPADEAIQRVYDRLAARAGDEEIQKLTHELPPQAAAGQAHKPELTGTDLAKTKRPASTPVARGRAGGPPTTVPGNPGKDTRPTPQKPTTPPGRGRGGL
ncbi:MAG: hypothetical protein ACREMA_06840 [Longimicrobiales bacterium]